MREPANNAHLPVVILGAGGHAAVLIDALRLTGRTVLGCIDPNAAPGSRGPLDTEILGNDDAIERFAPHTVDLVNGIGATDAAIAAGGQLRWQLHRRWVDRGYTFATIVHPSATIAAGCTVNAGAQIMAGAILQTGTRIGEDTIVNTGARVDHDCTAAEQAHIAPGAVLCGGVSIGEGAFIGAGATIIPGIQIGPAARIGAGMTILENVPANARLSPVRDGHGHEKTVSDAFAGAPIRAVATIP